VTTASTVCCDGLREVRRFNPELFHIVASAPVVVMLLAAERVRKLR